MKRRRYLKVLGLFCVASLTPLRALTVLVDSSCNACKEAWESLSRFNSVRYQFRYIEPTVDLPKVFIYGDSISIGYTEYVRSSLNGIADVMRLHVNGNSSSVFVDRMEAFKKALFQPFLKEGWTFEWDVIHFNVGLHDLKYLYNGKLNKEKGTQVTSLEEYRENLITIVKYLKTTYPSSKLIFATTTTIPEGEPGRISEDAMRYNKVALDVLEDHKDIIVNDLYALSLPVSKNHGIGYGDVHYKDEGSRLLGIEVAKVIANAIRIEPLECPSVEDITAKFRAYELEKK